MTTCRCINSGQSNFEFEYIGEFDTEYKAFLEYESGAQVASIGRKKQRAKVSCYCPLKVLNLNDPMQLMEKLTYFLCK
jgi:hypothetical protein